ncbi:MAG: glycine cleavage system protein GcvH [Chloroflexota bacterium]|nr:MAG: glycine cleavage system protein GcvH [Chloroflexota bacterium]
MNPKEYKYTREHEWICPESENKGKIGLTKYAENQLGDIVFLDLPAPGTQVQQFEKIGEVESVKAVTDLFSPASGKVIEINTKTVDSPNLVNEDPYGAGWLVRLEIGEPSELDALMNSDAYDDYVDSLSGESSG